jgi:hypothetical protein
LVIQGVVLDSKGTEIKFGTGVGSLDERLVLIIDEG